MSTSVVVVVDDDESSLAKIVASYLDATAMATTDTVAGVRLTVTLPTTRAATGSHGGR